MNSCHKRSQTVQHEAVFPAAASSLLVLNDFSLLDYHLCVFGESFLEAQQKMNNISDVT